MEKLEHELWIVQAVNAALGPLVAAALRPLGFVFPAGAKVIPDYVVMAALVVVAWTILCLIARPGLSVEQPGRPPIEIISHISRVLSLSLRLFGNIFGEELVIVILFSIVPFLVPLPMMFLGIITATLQAFIFVLLTTIYLGGAVATEHEHNEHGEMVAGEV